MRTFVRRVVPLLAGLLLLSGALHVPAAGAADYTMTVAGTGGAGLRLRADAGLSAAIILVVPEGAPVAVTGGQRNADGYAWSPVVYAGRSGWAASRYLAGGGDMQAPPSGGGGSIASVALRYQGYPYVWAGASPSGFDCSGFTMYVVQQALGRNIGHALGGQLGAGVAVDASNLAPGDLVFFQNTYQAGLSHVGIYLGGGQMIHAGSERTGVAISNIWDSYWAPKFYAARRL